MAVAFRPLPQFEMERVANAGGQLVEISKHLSVLRSATADRELAVRIDVGINRLLDVGETLSNAVRSVAYAEAGSALLTVLATSVSGHAAGASSTPPDAHSESTTETS
jgi:hypothetical protein